MAAGVTCTLGSDDSLLFGPGLLEEYELCRRELGMNDEDLAGLARNSLIRSGAPESLKRAGAVRIDAWLATGGVSGATA